MARFLHPKALKLRNFKGVAELDISLDESLTLLAGVNGVGKTSVLQALLAAVTHTWLCKPPEHYPAFQFPESVTRAGTTDTEIVLELAVPEQSPIALRFEVHEQGLRPESAQLGRLLSYYKELKSPLPLVVYYDQTRVVRPHSGRLDVTVSSKENRASSLRTTVSSPNEFKAWFFEKEADEGLETRERRNLEYEDSELEAVRKVLKQLDGFTAVRSRKPPESGHRTLYLVKDGTSIPFDSLSGGEQAFFLLAADLARRLMLASPGKGVEEAPGIVCIDEIELHLHPAWQKKILRTLMDTFPACQFVVSTHSPQVIGGVEAHHVRLIEPGGDGRRKVSQPLASKGRDSNYVLKGILDTPERDDGVSELFEEFDRLIDDGDLDGAERVLDDLAKAIEGESSRVAIRQAKWNRLRRTAE